MFLLKKLIRFLFVQMMIKECNQLIRYKHKHVEQTKIQSLENEIKCNITNKQYKKMINFDDLIKENIK